MATDDYQATWRGARRYQFDEEARRKAAARKVYRFRRIKHGDPKKLKVLAEDLRPKKRRQLTTILTGLLLVGATGAGYFADNLSAKGSALVQIVRQASGADCKIKGNISIETGERIYHVPGQKYYLQTRISPQYGERWFCSEAEARAAGWRRSRT